MRSWTVTIRMFTTPLYRGWFLWPSLKFTWHRDTNETVGIIFISWIMLVTAIRLHK